MKKMRDVLPETEILAQLAEEASELAQAALKKRRVLDGTNPTPVSLKEANDNLVEEGADVLLCLLETIPSDEWDDIFETMYNKRARFNARVNEPEAAAKRAAEREVSNG